MKALLILLFAGLMGTAQAADVDLRRVNSAGDGPQALIFIVQDAPGDLKLQVQHLGQDLTVDLLPIGEGVMAGTIRAETSRFAHIQVVAIDAEPPELVYSGLTVLPFQSRMLIAFQHQAWETEDGRDRQILARMPMVPYTRVEPTWGEAPIYMVAWGWSGVALIYLLGMAGLTVLRQRDSPDPEAQTSP